MRYKILAFTVLPLFAVPGLSATLNKPLPALRPKIGAAPISRVKELVPDTLKQPNVRRTSTTVGPFLLNAASVGANGVDSTLLGDSFFYGLTGGGFCNDVIKGPCTIVSGRIGLEFEDGTEANTTTGVYMHHIITLDQKKYVKPFISACNSPNPAADKFESGAGFIGSSEDKRNSVYLYTNPNSTTLASGKTVGKDDYFVANVMLVNYNKEPKTVFVRYDTEWVPGLLPDSRDNLLDITDCGKPLALSKDGETVTKSGKWTFLEDGKVTMNRGHLHDGGKKVDGYINDKLICSSMAVYGSGKNVTAGGATLSDMTPCYLDINVKKGDTFYMEVVYDLKLRPLRQTHAGHGTDSMGMMSIAFLGK